LYSWLRSVGTPRLRGSKVGQRSLRGSSGITLVVLIALALAEVGAAHAQSTSDASAAVSPAATPEAIGPPAPTPPPPGPSPADLALKADQEALKGEVTALKEQLELMSQILGAEREQRAEEVIGVQERAEKAEAARKLAPKVSGYVQSDWNILNQASSDQLNYSTGAPLNDQRFLVRRARLKLALDREYTAGVLEFDGNTVSGTQARLVVAEASAKISGERPDDVPLIMATIGMFKIPFGYELLQSDRDRLFMERSAAERALFPGEYDVGARLQGGWRFVRYAIAVQNGNPLGDKTFPGRDPNNAKDVTGRLGVDTPVNDVVRVSGGFSGLSGTGFHAGTAATKASVQWVDRNENGVLDPSELIATPGRSSTASKNFGRFGYGADLELTVDVPNVGKTVVYGEVYFAKNLDRAILPADPVAVGRDYRELGGYGALTQELGAYASVGVRYDYYRSDLDSTNQSRGLLVPSSNALQTVSIVAGARALGGRLTLEYDFNRNHNGLDPSGLPTNLESNTLILRGQWVY
jgi:hypothetical protein